MSLAAPKLTSKAVLRVLSDRTIPNRDRAEIATSLLINSLWTAWEEIPPTPTEISDWFELDRVRIAAKEKQIQDLYEQFNAVNEIGGFAS